MFKNHANHTAKSAGTSSKARIKISQKLIDWADVVFVMERKHKDLVKLKFQVNSKAQAIVVLDIEDNYQFGDAELIEIFKERSADYLQ